MTLERKSLPANPNVTQIKKQAEDLQRMVQAHDHSALARVVAFHPSVEDATEVPSKFALRDAQLTIAREYGFSGWHQLNTEVGNLMVEERDLHRWFGVQLNNGMWDVIEDETSGVDSPVVDKERVLYSAFASAYHWRNAGNEAHYARGEHLISRVAIKIGEADMALRHGRRGLELIEAHPDEMEDWDEPFAHEAIARAFAALGDVAAARHHRKLAESQTAAVAEEGDRSVLEAELDREPWFGLIE